MHSNIYKEKLKSLYQKKKVLNVEKKRVCSENIITYSIIFDINEKQNIIAKQIKYCQSKIMPDIIA